MQTLKAERIPTDDEIGQIIQKYIVSEFCENYILVGEERTCLPEYYLRYAEEIKNFEVKDDDIWVCSYPKTGTTWTQELVWLIANNFDYEGAKTNQSSRFPYLEISGMFDEDKRRRAMKVPKGEWKNSVEIAATQNKTPRFIKTHLPFSLLPDQIKNGTKKPKIVYVMRNPKDTCVSFYHHGILIESWKIDLENFAKVFIADKASYCSFWKHIFGFWEQRNIPNILILKFEEMKSDLPSVVKRVAKFLEKEITEEQVDPLVKYLSFDSFKNNQAVNKQGFIDNLRKHNMVPREGAFMRSGKVGKYREEFSKETIRNFDVWIKRNVAGTSLEQEYDFSV